MGVGEFVRYYLLPVSVRGYNCSKTSTTQSILNRINAHSMASYKMVGK